MAVPAGLRHHASLPPRGRQEAQPPARRPQPDPPGCAVPARCFCDCSSMRRLLAVQARAARDAQLRVAITPDGAVRRIVELMQMDRRLDIYPTAQAAIPLPGQDPWELPPGHPARHRAAVTQRQQVADSRAGPAVSMDGPQEPPALFPG